MNESKQDKKDIKNKKDINKSVSSNISNSIKIQRNSIDLNMSKINFEASGADIIHNDFEDPQKYVLKNISFKIREGESCAFVGETGSGKSTIIRLLFRLYDISEGEILINKINIASCTQQSLRGNLGIVPQDTCLFNSSLI